MQNMKTSSGITKRMAGMAVPCLTGQKGAWEWYQYCTIVQAEPTRQVPGEAFRLAFPRSRDILAKADNFSFLVPCGGAREIRQNLNH